MTAAYLLDLTVPLSIPKVVILPLGLEITKVPKSEALVPKIILYVAGRLP